MTAFAKVLVVDDEAHMRMYVSMLVRATLADVEVLEAGDEAAALALCEQHRPELVLLDINLIGTSGLELLPRMKSIHPKAVIVMLTAVNVRRAVEDAQEKGASGYILKESSHEEMADALRAVVRENFGDANLPPTP